MTEAAPALSLPASQRGLVHGVWAAVFYAFMAVLLYAIKLREPDVSFWVTSFVRITINLLALLAIASWRGTLGGIFADRAPTLWWRGVFGTASILCNFSSLRLIGIGESSFLHATNAVFIALLAPVFLKQKNGWVAWVAILGSLCGAYLMLRPWEGTGDVVGRAIALGSGIFAAMAYLMIARTGSSYSSITVIFYFCLVAFVAHLGIFAVFGMAWPRDGVTYAYLLGAGACGTGAQICLTKSYQTAKASLSAAVSYLSPVLSLAFQVIVFQASPEPLALVGSAIILGCGVALPFLTARRTPQPPVEDAT